MPPHQDPTIHLHLDIADHHSGSDALCRVTGWVAAEGGPAVVSIGIRTESGGFLACPFPFHRADVADPVVAESAAGMAGFSAVLPLAAGPVGSPAAFAVTLSTGACLLVEAGAPGTTVVRKADTVPALVPPPALATVDPALAGALLEERLLAGLARERRLTLRLDLINKCNLRCVMCHYSDERIALRPAQRMEPEQFAAFFDPLAPMTREVVLSCGDEPLMSPHFERIVRDLAARDPEVRITFCTNGMLLGERIARTIVEAAVAVVMFSFDGVTSATLHRIRVGSDYRRIIGNILRLREERARAGARRPRFIFNFVMLDSNIHEAPLFVRIARKLGGDTVDFRHVVPSDTYDIAHEMLERRPAKYNHYRSLIVAEAAACGMDIYIPPAFPDAGAHDPAGDPAASLAEFEAAIAELGFPTGGAPAPARPEPDPASRPEEAAHGFCDRPFREVMIREQREAYPCAWHQEIMGVADGPENLADIFLGPNFQALRLAMLDPRGAPGCRGCPIKAGRLPTVILPRGNPAP
jgi:MoaA/NifB/PqqE/SkfB family radical SAM enzyme